MKFCDASWSIDLIWFSISALEISIFWKCLSQSLLQLDLYSLTHQRRHLRYLSRSQSGSPWAFFGAPGPLLPLVLHQTRSLYLLPIHWYRLKRQTPENWKIKIEVTILIQKLNANRLRELTAATIVTTTTAINTFILDLKYFLFFPNFSRTLWSDFRKTTDDFSGFCSLFYNEKFQATEKHICVDEEIKMLFLGRRQWRRVWSNIFRRNCFFIRNPRIQASDIDSLMRWW